MRRREKEGLIELLYYLLSPGSPELKKKWDITANRHTDNSTSMNHHRLHLFFRFSFLLIQTEKKKQTTSKQITERKARTEVDLKKNGCTDEQGKKNRRAPFIASSAFQGSRQARYKKKAHKKKIRRRWVRMTST